MQRLTRRQMLLTGSALVITGPAATLEGQTPGHDAPASAALAQAHVFAFESLPAVRTQTGGERREIVAGRLQTGETVSLHESMLPPGSPPSPAHRIEHTEFIHVREGQLEFLHDGRAERAGPGSVILVAFGTMHSVRNVGETPARYLVTAIGGDVKA